MDTNFKNSTSWRFKARFLFQIFLAVGFTWQSLIFLKLYLQYQSTVELEVVQPAVFRMPAFTVCNINEFRYNHFCEALSKKCANKYSNADDCIHISEYCNDINITKVSNSIDSQFLNLSRYQQQILGHQYEDLVSSCIIEIDGEALNCTDDPVLVPALNYENIPINCFMMHSFHKKPYKKIDSVPVSTTIHLVLNMEVSEYPPAHVSRAAVLSIHTPYHVPSPVNEGIYLNTGSIYRIHVNVVEERLMPPPSKSNCTDYIGLWMRDGGKGPVTQKMCKELCKLEISLRLYGCAERRIHYPHNESMCPKAIPRFSRDHESGCAMSCSSPCYSEMYELTVQEGNRVENKGNCSSATDLSCATSVHIIFDNLKITSFISVPRYERVSFLSYIGGYVGVWLGISFLTVYDFLEKRLFLVVRGSIRLFRKITVSSEVKETTPPKYQIRTLTTVHD